MSQSYGHLVKARRGILGLSQRELSHRTGLKQPLIAAIESGRRQPSKVARERLESALALRPSQALEALRAEVHEIFMHARLPRPKVFGSVARGEDGVASDLDLVVEFDADHDIVDLLNLEHELSELLTVKVNVVDSRADGAVIGHARANAVPL